MKLLKLSLDKIKTNPNQPRKHFDKNKLEELKESIKNNGLIQPIIVKKIKVGTNKGKYEIVAGERRFRACSELEMTHIDAINIEVSDSKSYEYSVLENIQREDLNAIEEAESYVMLMDVYGYTQENLAEKLGKTRSSISNKIRLLKLPESIKELIKTGELSYGHARALIPLANEEEIFELTKKVIEGKYSVRKVETVVKKYNSKNKELNEYQNNGNIKETKKNNIGNEKKNETVNSYEDTENDEEKLFLEQKLREFFESKVQLKGNLQKQGKIQGKIEIDFYDYEDLARIIGLLNISFE